MVRARLVVIAPALAALAAVPVACTKGGSAAGDAGKADVAAPQASAPAPSASGLPGQVTMTSAIAEGLGMAIAAKRWPQYHPRMATALRQPGFYKVSIQMMEPVGAHVILDMQGNFVDGGTSNGEH